MRAIQGAVAAAAAAVVLLSADLRADKDFTAHMGGLPFVVGLDRGREEVKFTGRPAMLVFTSAGDQWCPQFAARTWTDKEVRANVAGYTPVLVDWDAAPQALKDRYNAVIVPAVIWLDFDESQVFMAIGDIPLELFRALAERAHDDCPDPGPPAEAYAGLLVSQKKLADAARAKDVKGQLAAIAEIRKVGHGEAVQVEAREADLRLTKEGEAEIKRARELIAGNKQTAAKKALEKLVDDYGAAHPVGTAAKEMIDGLAGGDASKRRRK